MRILLVNRWYPPHTGFGGVAIYNHYLAHALVEQGHRVTVLAARWSKDAPALQQDGEVRVIRLFASEWSRLKRLPVLGKYIRPLQQYLYSLEISRCINSMSGEDRPEVIEFAEVNAEGYHYLRRKTHIPAVVRCHTPTFILKNYYKADEMPFDTAWTTRMEMDSIRRANALTAPSRDMAQIISKAVRIPVEKITPIPNALCVADFSSAQEKRADPQQVTLLHVGRLDRVKGIEILAKAFCQLYPQAPQARLVFVGDDLPDRKGSTWRARLEKLFTQHNCLNAVHFTGGIGQAELLEWYRRADIAVVPSILYESFSYTCAQAMAAGLPIVASRIGGIPETVGDAGKIVEAGNAEQLAESILVLIRAPQARIELGKHAQERVNRLFKSAVVAESTAALYRKIAT
jgi:glycosyltransferase involved in cell wall biosynthesis